MEPVGGDAKRQKSGIPGMVSGGTVSWEKTGEPVFSVGAGTLRVPLTMHGENRHKLCAALRGRPDVSPGAAIFLQGGNMQNVYDTDTEWDFKQESNFQYLFGVKEAGCQAVLRISDARAVLLIEKLPEDYQAWLGPIKPPAWFQRAYAVDEVAYTSEAKSLLEELKVSDLLILKGDANRDSGLRLPEPEFEGKSFFSISESGSKVLWDELNECRFVKSPAELKILQYANDVSSRAHVEVMKMARPLQREHLSAATFKYQAALRGCFRMGYTCICPSGRRNSILHYGHPAEPNSEEVPDGCLKLHDMGAEYHGYTSDVTVTFPVSGRFSQNQRLVYDAVWTAVQAVEEVLKPGVCYKDMHRLAQKTLLQKMSQAGLFLGSVDEMFAAGLMSHFMPHGLGHSLGLDCHDVGGYAPGSFRKDDPSIRENLRLGRELKEGCVLTVEPGFYFIDYLIEEALADPKKSAFIDKDRLNDFWKEVGGVRIEDDVVITATGCRVLTCLPRASEDIEAVMAGQEWTISEALCRAYVAKSI